MEHKLGEIFEWRGIKLQVEETLIGDCAGCFFFEDGFCAGLEYEDLEGCGNRFRKDETAVVFRLIKEG